MNGNEFLKKLKKLAKTRGVDMAYVNTRGTGKGSHGTVYFGGRRTTLKDPRKEIGPGLLKSMLDDLDLTRDDL